MTQSPTRDPAGAEMEEIGLPVGRLPKTETTPLIEVTSAGPPPWFVYRITPRSATALSNIEPGGANPVAISDLS